MSSSQQFCTFFLDGNFFGAPAVNVQEVIRSLPLTSVPLAPEVIAGLINVRGQIVPVLDLRRRLGLHEGSYCPLPVNVVVRVGDCAVSLLVDEIGDVVEVPDEAFESPPATLHGSVCELLRGVYKLPGRLLLVLDLDRVIDLERSLPGTSHDCGRDDPKVQLPNTARRVQ